MARALMLCIFALLVLGCGQKREQKKPMFADFYRERENAAVHEVKKAEQFPLLTLIAKEMPLPEFLRVVAGETAISVICEQGLDSARVTCDVTNQPVDVVLSSVARRLGAELIYNRSMFYVGLLKPEDRAFLVRKVTRLSKDDLSAIAGLQSSEHGKSWSSSDGLVVLADRVEILNRVNDLFDQIEASQPGTWVIQFYLLSLSKSLQTSLGFDVTHAVDVSAAFASKDFGAYAGSHDFTGSLNALLDATRNSNDSKIVAEPLFLVQDGQETRMQDGDVVPIPKKTISNEGTVTITGYDRLETGLQVVVKVRQVGEESANLTTQITLSSVNGFIGEAPITSQSFFNTTATIRRRGSYLLGQLVRSRQKSTITGPFIPTKGQWDNGSNTLQVWSRVYQVR